MTAVEKVVADFARQDRHDLWPRFTARAAGVTTAEAREAMLDLVGAGLLDLWYVVVADSGDEVQRYKHPQTAPVGAEVTNFRAHESERFTVEPEDVYLMFSPTERLARIAGRSDDASPKVEGAEPLASAPVTDKPDNEELASRSSRWDGAKIEVKIEHLHAGDHYGHTIDGDIDTGSGVTSIGDQTTIGGGEHGAISQTPPSKPKKGSALVTYSALALAFGILVTFLVLGVTGTIEWKYALPAALGGSLVIGAGALLAGHLRG